MTLSAVKKRSISRPLETSSSEPDLDRVGGTDPTTWLSARQTDGPGGNNTYVCIKTRTNCSARVDPRLSHSTVAHASAGRAL